MKYILAALLALVLGSSASATTYSVQYQRPVDPGDNLIYRAPTTCCTRPPLNVVRRKTAAGSVRTRNYPSRVVTPNMAGQGQLVFQICWFQETTHPGYQYPETDKFLGCDSFYISTDYTAPTRTDTIGARVGTPNQDAPPCEGYELSINDDFVPKDGPGDMLRDINAVWNGGYVVGWMLQGFAHDAVTGGYQRYYVPNLNTQPAISFNISFKFVSGTYTPPAGYGAIRKWTGMLPPGSQVKKCFSKGHSLV